MDLPVGDAKGVSLNTASEDELALDAGLGPQRARRMVANRPFRSWEDVRNVEGMTDAIVEALQRAGAELGDPEAARMLTPEEERMLQFPEGDEETRGKHL
jgi:hypothetical protein